MSSLSGHSHETAPAPREPWPAARHVPSAASGPCVPFPLGTLQTWDSPHSLSSRVTRRSRPCRAGVDGEDGQAGSPRLGCACKLATCHLSQPELGRPRSSCISRRKAAPLSGSPQCPPISSESHQEGAGVPPELSSLAPSKTHCGPSSWAPKIMRLRQLTRRLSGLGAGKPAPREGDIIPLQTGGPAVCGLLLCRQGTRRRARPRAFDPGGWARLPWNEVMSVYLACHLCLELCPDGRNWN